VAIDKVKQYISFYLKGKLFGIDIRVVNEVNPNVRIVPIPLAAPHIRGHVNIRGQVVLVIDIMVIFGFPKTPVSEKAPIIILKTYQDLARVKDLENEIEIREFPDKPVGIVSESVGDVIQVQAGRIETPTQYLDKSYAGFIDGIVKMEHQLLTVLNPVKILNFRNQTKEPV
jgi:purine-binding chemotaxis protein CheW